MSNAADKFIADLKQELGPRDRFDAVAVASNFDDEYQQDIASRLLDRIAARFPEADEVTKAELLGDLLRQLTCTSSHWPGNSVGGISKSELSQ